MSALRGNAFRGRSLSSVIGSTSTDTGLSARASSRIALGAGARSPSTARGRCAGRARRPGDRNVASGAVGRRRPAEPAGSCSRRSSSAPATTVASAVDDRDAIGDLIDFGDLVRREEDGHLRGGDVGDQRLEHLFGHRGIEAGRRFVEDEQLRAAAQRQQQRELGAHAARQRLHAAGSAAARTRADSAASRSRAPARKEARREADHLARRSCSRRDPCLRRRTRCAAGSRRSRLRRVGGQAQARGRVPLVGRAIPSSILIVVVLPAPLLSEEAVDRAGGDLEVQPAHRLDRRRSSFADRRFRRRTRQPRLLLRSALGEASLRWSSLPAPPRTAAGSPRRSTPRAVQLLDRGRDDRLAGAACR